MLRATPRADQQIRGLSRKRTREFNRFLDDLASRGCKALAYRLSGPTPIDHLCVKHLGGSLRIVVAFESAMRAWILLVGPHDDQDPGPAVVELPPKYVCPPLRAIRYAFRGRPSRRRGPP